MYDEERAEAIAHEVLRLAVVVRDEGPAAVEAAAREALLSAGGDPVAALTVAAALIRIDIPVDPWWQDPQLPVVVNGLDIPVEFAKNCTGCRRTKPISEFGRDRSRPDGLNYRCRACRRFSPTPARKRSNGHAA